MKITGSNSYINFDLENGYIVKAKGEMLTGGKFVVFTNSMKTWEPPHENEKISVNEVQKIIRWVTDNTNKDTVQILFE